MPIQVDADIRYLSQHEFAQIAYEVMEHVFTVHNEMGRFFDEDIYRDAVAQRVPDSQAEVLIEVRFEDFVKPYYMDLLVQGGAPFELKVVRALGPAHRAQLLNYLLLTGLSHGKLANLRPQLVEHEFVNAHITLADRRAFQVADRSWNDPGPNSRPLRSWLLSLLHDVGAGLDLHLYEAAVAHFFGGEESVVQAIDILAEGQCIGSQKVRLAAPGWAFKVTAIDDTGMRHFEDHTRRFLNHTTLHGFHWINVTRTRVTFTTLQN